ncbi:MAG: N-acetylmuramoyl-L-alanine amidase [Lachnospiraceae bacterium]|jgi:N-acetylmuramoyl-L-alanine amidase|nr:N-acetylmuramoyl-L-alanine amidase [Lachnospiraceae bacterium]
MRRENLKRPANREESAKIKNRILIFVYIAILISGIITSFPADEEVQSVFAMPLSKKIVVIDAGHGGWDPGKVSENDIYEKDINLKIALKLQQYLQQGDCYVLLTRASDEALGSKKREDMDNRKDIADNMGADVIISIHQNSFPSSKVKGSQVFYYKTSEKSKVLAEKIQGSMRTFLSQEGNRLAKANDNYYILKQTAIPAVIVECGFLSNPSERALLTQDDYIEKIAWSIYMGVVDYFNAPSHEVN